ncbi:FAD-binding domain-containing protein [Mycena rosella]|uniref:FAD-binding domain-containing protein n=1 Tax=Mycena rosella TaxID=1033263 RepID=A0AAD7CN88_MYCRO|nr:FAD-binding domain-containing protein [Mycena rosella]
MPSFRFLVSLLALASGGLALDICAEIAQAVSSSSDVYYPTDLLGRYSADIAHWASSSTQLAACTVEPGTAADVSVIIKLLGATQTPFAVKGGGHTANPGFSSTTGVQIAMRRFSGVTYDAASQTAVIGVGLVWDDVYTALAPFDVNVVGGRVSGVGVAGFTLGGGYSWKTNQYGLTVDTVVAYELVKPNGTIVTVTASSDEDLFFGLKGGLNNFGIVTQFTLKTVPQGQVWGGLITYTVAQIPAVSAAVEQFASTVTDPKAGIIPAYNFLLGQPGISHIMFYDGPTPPAGIFDAFLAIPHLTEDVETRSFLSLVTSAPSNATTGSRGAFHTVSLLSYSPTMVDAIVNETNFWGAKLALAGASFISYDIEPFLPSIYTHNTLPTAFPPSRGPGYQPLNLYFAWESAAFDATFHDALLQSAAHLTQVALNDGQDISGAPLYTNYALYDTPLERIYGANLPRLRTIKSEVDPGNVMGLAGGFRF